MKNKIIKISALSAFLLLLFVQVNKTLAQQIQQVSVTLANAKNEVKLDPGETHRFTMKLYNKSDNPIIGTVKLVDFIVKDNDGKPIFLEDLTTPISNRFAASSWMSVPYDRVAIAPNDKVAFDISVNVPLDARPGGHYAAVIFEASGDSPAGQQSASSVSHRVAGLFYITVSGAVTEKALLTKLSLPFFSEYGPVKATSIITNKGDTHISPKGFLTVTNWFGRMVTQSPLEELNIFPDVSRTYENLVGEHFMVGRYKLALTSTYGEEGQVLEGYDYFWVVPWRIVTAIALTLAILILLFKNWRKKAISFEKELQGKLAEEDREIERLKEELKNRS